ncbi:MAG: hypothetical protein FWE71_00415 [Nocardioidaceae bacterium]|nr:hypothetical protein [Nocardioidaceae bacterium]MCL2614701.1 hypothetical protein [Nocardioidaceae bacterium]
MVLTDDEETPLPQPRGGCAVRLSALVIVFFVNVPLFDVGPRKLWHTAPVLVVVALMVDVFLLLLIGIWIWRRARTSVPD